MKSHLLSPEEEQLIQKHREGSVALWWSPEDVKHQAKSDDVELTEEEIKTVMKGIEDSDATLGVNWEVISTLIMNVVLEREN